MSSFVLTIPNQGATPVLVEVPHAGVAVPDGLDPPVAAAVDDIERDADLYVDDLYSGASAQGATVLASRVSRYVVDLNRAPDDVDDSTVRDHPAPRGSQPRGVVWRVTSDAKPILPRPLTHAELVERLERFHAPYHAVLEEQLRRLRDRFGFAILLAAHSMPSTGRIAHADRSVRRADIVPGTRGRTTADGRLIDLVSSHFRAAGLTVRHDEPYRGGWSTGRYGKPAEAWHALQIEINRALYMDERTAKPRGEDFDRLRVLLDALVRAMGALDLR